MESKICNLELVLKSSQAKKKNQKKINLPEHILNLKRTPGEAIVFVSIVISFT